MTQTSGTSTKMPIQWYLHIMAGTILPLPYPVLLPSFWSGKQRRNLAHYLEPASMFLPNWTSTPCLLNYLQLTKKFRPALPGIYLSSAKLACNTSSSWMCNMVQLTMVLPYSQVLLAFLSLLDSRILLLHSLSLPHLRQTAPLKSRRAEQASNVQNVELWSIGSQTLKAISGPSMDWETPLFVTEAHVVANLIPQHHLWGNTSGPSTKGTTNLTVTDVIMELIIMTASLLTKPENTELGRTLKKGKS